jgi:C4-type Zn-finger protein
MTNEDDDSDDSDDEDREFTVIVEDDEGEGWVLTQFFMDGALPYSETNFLIG